MKSKDKGIAGTVAGVLIVVLMIVAGAAGYLAGNSNKATTTTTSISTVVSTTTALSTVTSATTATITSNTTISTTAAPSALVQQAEQECATENPCLTVYTTEDSFTFSDYYADAFYAQYPFAAGKVDWVALSSSQVETEAISQLQAGKVSADAFSVGGSAMIALIQAGAIQNYTDPVIAGNGNFTSGTYDPEGAWVGTNYQVDVVAYNTKLISASQLPANGSTPLVVFSALANPAFKGEVAFQSATTLSISGAPFYYLYSEYGNSSGSWNTLMNQIAANKPIITSSSGVTASDIATGTAAIGIVGYEDALSEEASGAPVRMVLSNPLLGTISTSGIAKDAPHPAMAELWEQWFTSVPGQLGLAASGRAPLYTNVGVQYDLVPSGYSLVNAIPDFSVYSDATAWASTFMTIFGA